MTLTPQQLVESLDRLRHRLATLSHELHDLALDTADMEQHANLILHDIHYNLRVDRHEIERGKRGKKGKNVRKSIRKDIEPP